MKCREKLEKMWRLRHNRQLADCARELRAFRGTGAYAKEAEVVRASLLRAEGNLVESDAILGSLREQGFECGGRVAFQTGLNFFARGDYARAWPYFQSARAVLRDPHERMMASGNLVGCRDSLGLNFDQELAELEADEEALPSNLRSEHSRSQIKLLAMRVDFRRGKFTHASGEAQAAYFQQWLARLPYTGVSAGSPDPQALPSHFFAFRLNTLLGKAETPPEKVKASEWIDRIYLWTWRWLVADPAFPLPKVVEQIGHLGACETLASCEDYLLLRNALGWLDLFAQTGVGQALLPKFSMSSAEFPLLESEFAWIQHFRATLNGTTTLPPAAGPLNLGREETFLAPFYRRLDHLVALRREEPNTLYPARGLAFSASGKKLRSAEAVQLAGLTLDFPALPFATIAAKLWGIRAYDPLVHATRVHRVAKKVRDFFDVELRSREEILHAHWKTKPRVWRAEEIGPLPDEIPAWKALGEKKVEATATVGRGRLRREDVEKQQSCSRSAAARWLKRQVDAGLLLKLGRGKNVQYEWRTQ